MTRLSDTILQKGQGLGGNSVAPMLNPTMGGHFGYDSEYTEVINSAAYIRKNIVLVMIKAPTGVDFLDNPELWRASMRAFFELHPKVIEGFARGLEVEFAETPVGAAGEMQEHATDVKRARTQLAITIDEKDGMPFAALLEGWIMELIMNPNTKVADVMTRANRPTDLLPDVQGCTLLAYEPNAQHTAPLKAWLGTHIMPRNSGENVGRREMTAASELTTYNIPFTGVWQSTNGVLKFAERLMAAMNISGANANARPAFMDAIDANVLATKKSYENGMENLGSTAVTL
jgi:hypothetical protein